MKTATSVTPKFFLDISIAANGLTTGSLETLQRAATVRATARTTGVPKASTNTPEAVPEEERQSDTVFTQIHFFYESTPRPKK